VLLNFKALVVILSLALVTFALAKPLWVRFTAPEDFARRRTVWLVLTTVAFLSPSFWLYLLVAAPLIVWAARRDSTPVALYALLLFVIPPMEVTIPTIGIQRLFDLSNLRILTLLILFPAVWTHIVRRQVGGRVRLNSMDAALLGYGLLQLVLLLPYESPTNTMRRAFLFLVDIYVVYFAFSRLLSDKRQFADTLGALCLAAAIFAPIALFETVRDWLLYIGMGQTWGQWNREAYLLRGGSLRAQAAMGHSITLGYIFAMAIGSWLFLRSTQDSKPKSAAILALLTVGLYVTYARGPWLTAAVTAAVFAVLAVRRAATLGKGVFMLIVVCGLGALTPYGARVVDNLPFIGTQGQDTIAYRQQLAEVSWGLIQQHPFFGNPFVLLQMEELRSGGIIDLVNGYLQVALFHGLVGLALYGLVFLIAIWRTFRKIRASRAAGDGDAILLGSSLLACMVATMFFIATAGSSYLQWLLVGLLASYAALREPVAAVPPGSRPAADQVRRGRGFAIQ
jgi:O-antigen ligase